ncbi:hypothetical protein Q8W71_02595 [Methylobacterium sp. NEAU 140]|nr:hypothetical protein [Methylobacterium sp. NEAU 140]MDP4021499.1 hypothetical protein [Methylobacterium sp. NEAU 140]
MDDITVEIEEAERSMLLVQIGTPAGAIRVVGQVSMRDGVLMVQEAHI